MRQLFAGREVRGRDDGHVLGGPGNVVGGQEDERRRADRNPSGVVQDHPRAGNGD